MSERRLQEFQERAEFLVDVPDLHELRRRGTRRRRTRIAAGAALIASALIVGGTVVSESIEDQNAIGPAQTDPAPPPYAWEDHPTTQFDMRYVDPGPTLLRLLIEGPAGPIDLEARFVVPRHGHWYLGDNSWVGQAPLFRGPEGAPYIRVDISEITGVDERRCRAIGDDRADSLPHSIQSVAQMLVASSDINVLEPPERVSAFGQDAVHVRFTIPDTCPEGEAFVLWRAPVAGADRLGQDWGVWPMLADHIFDVWVLDVRGQHLVVSVDHTVDAREGDLAALRRLLDSLTLAVGG